METNWSLKELYNSFDDEKFINDIEEVKGMLEDMKKYPDLDPNEHNLKQYLIDTNNLNAHIQILNAFISLSMSTDTSNEQAIQYHSVLQNILASFASTQASLDQWISSFNLDELKDEYVLAHMFILKETQDHQKYLLDEQSEEVLANMKTTGSSAWLQYKNQLVSSLTVTIDDKTYPLTEALTFAHSSDQEVRRNAYEAEVQSYGNVEKGIASALNAIKGESILESKMRGYKSVLERTLKDSRMEEKTLNALLSAIKKALPMFERYYLLKAKKLGHTQGLPWYDLYAPVIECDNHYPYEKGADFVVKQFSTFSKDLGDYASKAISQSWIDVYPKAGKVGGAFCDNINAIKESRFLLNYGNQLSDVIVMGHELGHGYHGECLKDEYLLNTNYSMPIAETASIFCETIIKNAALKEASDQEKLAILDNAITDYGQVICDIYSRFLFESRVIEQRKQGPLSVEKIKETMIQAQKEAYGNGLDHNYLHPYMWTWKPHYYESDYAFYNFPYTFGLLLAKGLYAMYLKEKEGFPEKYVEFLSKTGKMTLEEVCMTMGIDIQDEEFWMGSIEMIKEDIDLFEELL